mmetsp:Transcript_2720/g.6219  ORF Transcript_2720/g.6219 Transcript_2720/m.6219 type:complete len:112 (+) Transcript_2720:58-393(+)
MAFDKTRAEHAPRAAIVPRPASGAGTQSPSKGMKFPFPWRRSDSDRRREEQRSKEAQQAQQEADEAEEIRRWLFDLNFRLEMETGKLTVPDERLPSKPSRPPTSSIRARGG